MTAEQDVIELRVSDIAQLFHTLDPFPFREQEAYQAFMPASIVVDQIDQFARRDMLASLPIKIDELMERLEGAGAGGDVES